MNHFAQPSATTRTARFGLAAFTALVTLVLAGCGGAASQASSQEPATNTTVSAAPVSSIAKLVPASIARAGTVRVGVALGSPPDEFQDQDGRVLGWEVDLVRVAAQVMGLNVTFSPASFDSLIPGLQANRYDLAIGQFGITAQRENVVDFVSTLSSNELLAAKVGTTIAVHTLADLCGHSVATTRGAHEVQFAQQQDPQCLAAGKKPIDIKVFDNSGQASLALMSGRVEVFWLGSTAISYFVQTTHGQAKVIGHYLDPQPIGTALQKNSLLGRALQAAMQHNIDSGLYRTVLDKWGLAADAIHTSELDPAVSSS